VMAVRLRVRVAAEEDGSMMQAQLEQEVLDRLDSDERREFVQHAVLDKAFALPLVASFELDSLDMGSVSALTPNGS
jgi:hypothetical protein